MDPEEEVEDEELDPDEALEVEDDEEDPDADGPQTGVDLEEETQEETPVTAAPAPGAGSAVSTAAEPVKPTPQKVSSYLTDSDRATIRQWREQGMDEDDIQVAIAETVATRREAAREASEFYIEVERRENPAMIDELRPYIRRALSRQSPDVASTQAGVNIAIAQALLDACAVEGGEHKPLSSALAKFGKGQKATASTPPKPKPASPATSRVPTNGNSGSGTRAAAGAGRVSSDKMKELYG